MDTKSLFRYSLLAISIFCMSAGCEKKLQFEKGNIPRDIAYQLALKEINLPLDEVDIWASKEKIKANTAVPSWGELVVSSPSQESWFFFVDEVPNANWSHPCQYLFVDMDGNIYRYSETTPPAMDMDLLNMSEFKRRALSVSPVSIRRGTKMGE